MRWSITVPITAQIRACIGGIDETAGSRSPTPKAAKARVAETTYVGERPPGAGASPRGAPQPADRPDPAAAVAQLAPPRVRHRRGALDRRGRPVPPRPRHRGARHPRPRRGCRDGALPLGGSSPTPPGSAAPCWPHNLIRWTIHLGDVHPHGQLTVARTVRSRLLAVPARVVNRSGRLVCGSRSDDRGRQRSSGRLSDFAPCRPSPAERQTAVGRRRRRARGADNPTKRLLPRATTVTSTQCPSAGAITPSRQQQLSRSVDRGSARPSQEPEVLPAVLERFGGIASLLRTLLRLLQRRAPQARGAA